MAGFALRVATFNIRNLRDRYAERWPLLREAFLGLDAGIVGLQEVGIEARPADEHDGVHGGSRQDDALMAAAPAHRYRSSVAPYQQWKGFGLATLQRAGEILVHEQLALSHGRVAQRLLIALPGARTLWFANTHLHHKPLEPGVREEQAAALIAWMASAPAADAVIFVGDFNASPREAAYRAFWRAGYRSALWEAHGREPAVTWPSGIQAPGMDTDGGPACLDYLWVRGGARVVTVAIAADTPAAADPTLYPSDHFALIADLDLH